jgi:hypothetical protein
MLCGRALQADLAHSVGVSVLHAGGNAQGVDYLTVQWVWRVHFHSIMCLRPKVPSPAFTWF